MRCFLDIQIGYVKPLSHLASSKAECIIRAADSRQSREQGAGSREQRAESREQRAGNREQGVDSREQMKEHNQLRVPQSQYAITQGSGRRAADHQAFNCDYA
jgi:hypothetical protein